MSSTAAFVASATKGVAKGSSILSGDKDFERKRDEIRRQNAASSGGVLSGFKAGGESVLSGFKSGLTGLVTKPLEEGRKTGALGFLKGVGLGLAGAAVKPVVGITDGIAAVSHGVTNRIEDVAKLEHIRPKRAFERAPSDHNDLLLVPLDYASAYAQALVHSRASKGGYNDSFVTYVSLGSLNAGNNRRNSSSSSSSSSSSPSSASSSGFVQTLFEGGAVVLSEEYVIKLRQDDAIDWVCPLGDISHCVLHFPSVDVVKSSEGAPRGGVASSSSSITAINPTIELVIYKGGARASLMVVCSSKVHATRLYSALYRSADRMGNPSGVLSLDMALREAGVPDDSSGGSIEQSNASPSSPSSSSSSSSSFSGSTDRAQMGEDSQAGLSSSSSDYHFGTANINKHQPVNYTEREVLLKAASRFKMVLTARIPLSPSGKDSSGKDGGGGGGRDEGQTTIGLASVTMKDIHRTLDERTWQLVCDWRSSHGPFNQSRCLAAAIINHSRNPIQLLRVEMLEGRSHELFAFGVGPGFDTESRTLLANGGACIVFAYGNRPTLLDLAHVKISIFGTAFNATLSTRKNRTTCEGVGGCNAGYLEKSLEDYWGKYVVCIT